MTPRETISVLEGIIETAEEDRRPIGMVIAIDLGDGATATIIAGDCSGLAAIVAAANGVLHAGA
jgi:hypothetical protein